jgi:protein-serine/threonine kinase
MLAGYLPFDDDPANPEGDNINLLYKYIVSTPLTFPEYVTPHARDLLKRILVPDPRKRADLFEVARHSWLSEYASVVGFITSSTTTENDIANTTVPAGKLYSNSTAETAANALIEDVYDQPHLARSASVREPSKPHTTVPAVGGLTQKTGQVDQPPEKAKTPRDAKRRTVQVEYVAPQSSTTRGEPSATKSRARSGSQGPVEVGPLPPPKPYEQPVSSVTSAMPPPPTRPGRDQQRAASESVTQSGAGVPGSATRPSTQGSMTGARLPSRGNSYGQPAVSVTQEQAQGRFSQPKKQQYTISHPNPQEQAVMNEGAYAEPSRRESYQKGHKRSNTIGEKIGSIFGRNSMSHEQKQAEKAERERSKRYPPMAMKQPYVANNGSAEPEPRRSTDSRRTSFSFGRKTTNSAEGQTGQSQRSSRRFSLIPASLKNFSNRDSQQRPPGSAHSEQRRISSQPRSRQDSRHRMGFGRSGSRSPSRSTMNTMNSGVPNYYDDRPRDSPPPRSAAPPASAPAQQTHFSNQPYSPTDPYAYQNGYDNMDLSTDPLPASASRAYSPQLQSQQQHNQAYRPGQYPQGFNDSDDVPVGRAQSGRLQKHKRFTDAYEDDRASGSGAPKRVMDFFRRMGRSRTGEER